MLDDDPDVFLDDDGLDGVLDGSPVRVLFAAPGDASLLAGVGVAADKPRALLPRSACPPLFLVPGAEPVLELPTLPEVLPDYPARWLVREERPDGMGWVTLILVAHPDQD